MGCGSSSEAARHRREAEEYAKRKKNGFKDPGLEKFRKDAVRQKKRLKHVDDPLSKKQNPKTKTGIGSKQQQQQQTSKSSNGRNKQGNGSSSGSNGPAVLSEDTIQAQRKKLKRVN
jgi:hypothetical protein